MSLESISVRYGHLRARAFRSSPYSILSLRAYQFKPKESFSEKVTFTHYCKSKFISKSVGKRLIALKYLAVTKHGRHIWVEEICPDLIKRFLE